MLTACELSPHAAPRTIPKSSHDALILGFATTMKMKKDYEYDDSNDELAYDADDGDDPELAMRIPSG